MVHTKQIINLVNSQKGLTPIAILIIVAIVAVVSISVIRNQNTSKENTPSVVESSPSSSPTSTPSAKPVVTNKKASPTPSPTASSKVTSSPSPTASTSKLSCELKLRDNQSSNGYAPYTVYFFGHDNSPNAGASTQWDFDGDGKWDTNMSDTNNTSYTYQKVGTYNVKLQTHNTTYGDTSCSTTITVKVGTVECKVHADKTAGGAAREFDFAYETTRVGTLENVDNNKDLVEAAQWDFDGNGSWDTPFDAVSKKLKYIYSSAGNYNVRLQVRAQGNVTSEVCTKTVSVE